ncbi:restriction endonuclease subunit S [Psychrobacter faecalis]|uniref:restriction endonuclease subunit S n=1 Tax=Psychrobacter faecalis TaxID=180588 RepID=UPI00191ADCFC|nr:restriction endonuclease subunit S [Psychrobacter faecalis]
MSDLSYMNKLLDGVEVEWKELWQVTIWDKKFNAIEREKQPNVIKYYYFLAKDLKSLAIENGDVKLLTTNSSDIWTSEELAGDKISEGEIIAIPWGGNAIVQYYKGKFVTTDNRIATSTDKKILSNKFLYYYLLSQIDLVSSFYRGSGIKHPSMYDVLHISIPLPPINIQTEIVRILDAFTELTAELTTELVARKQQYAHYRENLLTFNKNQIKYKNLGDVVNIKNGKDWKKLGSGDIPVYGSGGIMTYVDTYSYDKPTVLIPRKGSITNIFYIETPFWNVDTIYYTEIDTNQIMPKFFYYYMKTIDLMRLDTGSGRPSLTQAILNIIEVPVPPLPEQERIVAILDKFDTLTTSLTEGLPGELKLRQQQYEYYRELLLSFPKLEGET